MVGNLHEWGTDPADANGHSDVRIATPLLHAARASAAAAASAAPEMRLVNFLSIGVSLLVREVFVS